jgi:type IX secretion system PorP/SprF family membrane protein
MIKIYRVYIIFALILPTLLNSQQLPQFTQYMFNTIAINPAYAGVKGKMNISFLNRNQWVGVNGAPVTQTLAVHSGIPGSKVGVGLSLIHDKLGYENNTFIYADFSYTIDFERDYKLSFGIKAGMNKYGLENELLTNPDAIGDQYLDNIFNDWKPNIGLGLFYRNEEWFLGVSSPRLFEFKNNSGIEYLSIERVSYYINGGYLLEFNPQLYFKPTFLVKFTNGAPPSVDLTANFLFNDKFWTGLSYRLGDALGGYISLQATDNMKFGYAYEFVTSDISPYTSGSHEMFISYEFNFPRPKCKCKHLE